MNFLVLERDSSFVERYCNVHSNIRDTYGMMNDPVFVEWCSENVLSPPHVDALVGLNGPVVMLTFKNANDLMLFKMKWL